MSLFGRKKEPSEKKSFDRENEKPALRCSICTGEQVFGFKNRATGKFEEVSLIRSEEELKRFLGIYGIEEGEVEKFY